SDPAVHFDKVEILLRTERKEEAAEASEQAVQEFPENPDAFVLHGDVVSKLGRTDTAIALYERALEIAPEHVRGLSQLGNSLAEQLRFEEALGIFDRLLAKRPKDAEAVLCRGLLLVKLQRTAEGLAEVDRAIDLDAKLLEAYLQKARILKTAGRLDEAKEAAELAIRKTPRYLEGYVVAADIALEQGDIDRVFALTDRAQAIDGTAPDVWRLKSQGHARKGRAAAATVCRGLHFLYLGQHEAALAEMEGAADLEPELPHAWHHMGTVLEAMGRDQDALEAYKKALALDDTSPKVLFAAGLLVAEKLDRFEDGVRVLQKACSYNAKLWNALPPHLQKRVSKPGFW
ncbi:tetratricopeptide repeat protein, partial [Planctomycetota bacterium]